MTPPMHPHLQTYGSPWHKPTATRVHPLRTHIPHTPYGSAAPLERGLRLNYEKVRIKLAKSVSLDGDPAGNFCQLDCLHASCVPALGFIEKNLKRVASATLNRDLRFYEVWDPLGTIKLLVADIAEDIRSRAFFAALKFKVIEHTQLIVAVREWCWAGPVELVTKSIVTQNTAKPILFRFTQFSQAVIHFLFLIIKVSKGNFPRLDGLQQPFMLRLNNSNVVRIVIINPADRYFRQAQIIGCGGNAWETKGGHQNQITHRILLKLCTFTRDHKWFSGGHQRAPIHAVVHQKPFCLCTEIKFGKHIAFSWLARKLNRVVVSATFKPVIKGSHLSDVYAVTLGRNYPTPAVCISGQFTALFIIIDEIKSGCLFSNAQKSAFFIMVNSVGECGSDERPEQNPMFHFCAEKDERDVETVAVSRRTCLPCSTNSRLDCSILERCPMTASRPSKAAPVASAVRMPAYTYIPIENMKIEANAFSSAGSIVGVKVAYSAIPSARIPPMMKIRPVTFRRIRSSVITNLFELMLRYETNKGGSHCNTRYTGSSHDKLVLVTAPAQGDCGQLAPYNVATHQSKYALINSRLSDQLERSEV